MQSLATSMLHEQMQYANAKPSIHTLIAALKACSIKLTLQDGKRVHAQVIEADLGSNLFAGNSLIDMYGKCKSLEDALNVFVYLKGKDLVSWNAIIGGSTINGDHNKALQLFQQLVYEGIEPDRVTLICILKACASISGSKKGMQLHVYIMDNCHLWEDGKVKNTLVDMYCKCGMIKCARHVFDSSTNKSVVSWNAMIAGYSQQQGESSKAFKLFQEMQSCGMESNATTCISILKACCTASALQEGILVYFYVIEKGLELDVCVASALIDMYSKCGALEDAQKVFHRSTNRDVVMWSALIGGYAYNGQCVEAFDLFEKMQQHGIEPNYITYLSILKVCTKLASLDHGKQIHDYIKHNGIEIVTCIGNALIDMYIKCGSLKDAHNVFDNLSQRSSVTWSTLIVGNIELGFFEEGLLLFKRMQKEGYEPSSITLAYIFKTCSSINALAEGKLAHAFCVELSAEHDVLVGNTLIYMYANCRMFEDACSMFQNFSEFDVVTWSAMIMGCPDYKMALQYYTSMLRTGIKPNDVTFVGLLSACSQTGLVSEGLKHFRSMTEEFGITASFEHYNCIIDLLGRVGRVLEAGMLLLTMPFEPNAVVKTSLLSHCKMLGDVNLGKNYIQPQ